MDKEMQSFLIRLDEVSNTHSEYKREAYHFIMAGLNYTISKIKEKRHVTGQELCQGLREYALDQFGPLAKTVFEYWGVQETYDFGKIVFYLIEAHLMTKTDEDTVDDFKNVYSFEEAFTQKIEYDI